MMKAGFERNYRRQTTFHCRSCLRHTRDVDDNGSVDLCTQCHQLTMLENALMDGYDITHKDIWRAGEWIAQLQVKKGSPLVIRDFEDLLEELKKKVVTVDGNA